MGPANYLPCLEGELLYSWICRMAEANALDSRFFADCFLHRSPAIGIHFPFKYDSTEFIGGLFNGILPFPGWEDADRPVSFFLEHSLYGCLAPFLPAETQDKLIRSMFNPNQNSALIRRSGLSLLGKKALKACPECISERGRIFLRVHQLPGMTVCPEHGCRLHVYRGKPGNEIIDDTEMEEISESHPLEQEYSVFYGEFERVQADCSAEDTETAIHRKLTKELEDPSSSREFSQWLMERYGYSKEDVSITFPLKALTKKNRTVIIPKYQLMMLLFLVFDSPGEFRSYLEDQTVFKKEFMNTADLQGYELEGPWRKTFVILRHREVQNDNLAGHPSFIVTPNALQNGWGCPCCDKGLTDQERFASVFEKRYGKQYTLENSYSTLSTPVKIRHKQTNRITVVKASNCFDGVFR